MKKVKVYGVTDRNFVILVAKFLQRFWIKAIKFFFLSI
jgi:hypothetical protein